MFFCLCVDNDSDEYGNQREETSFIQIEQTTGLFKTASAKQLKRQEDLTW